MAAAAWKLYDSFKNHMGSNILDLNGGNFDLHLFKSGTNASDFTLSAYTSITVEVSSVNGYIKAGKAMVVSWITGDNASQQRWDMADIIWTATGGVISAVLYAVIVARTGASAKDPVNKLVGWSKLSTLKFDLAGTNTLTISTPANDGIFEMA